MSKQNIEIGEWQRDERGQVYRQIGNCREYAAQINRVVGATVEPKRVETDRICPFDKFALTVDANCRTDCALYRDGGCKLAGAAASEDTINRRCPFMRTCNNKCALYNGGCTLIMNRG